MGRGARQINVVFLNEAVKHSKEITSLNESIINNDQLFYCHNLNFYRNIISTA
jgi:hypothetical protein